MSDPVKAMVDEFLSSGPFAVVGASADRGKFGNKVLRTYLQNNLTAYPINPKETEIEGQKCFPDLKSLPEAVESISVITPPAVTEKIVEEAAQVGVKRIWMQIGSESEKTIQKAQEFGLKVIAGGPCVLVVLGFSERL